MSRWQFGSLFLTALGLALGLVACGGDRPDDAAKTARPETTVAALSRPTRVKLIWPTPNPAWAEAGELSAYVQPTVSGDVRSGLFGSVRSGGRQFHEGLDLFPLERDRQGEPIDPVFAVLPGVVRHASNQAGNSSYGRYVVLEHPQEKPAVYTLYAHLRELAPGVTPGREVEAGARLGTMGRSAGGYTIPKERAHLHFELGLRVTDRFAAWYAARGFGSPNPHGLWNGMNLMGVDPLALFARQQRGDLRTLADFFAEMPPAVVLQTARSATPDFVRRYPELVADGGSEATLAEAGGGWEITLNPTGVPFRWRRMATAETVGWKPGEVRIVQVDEPLRASNRGRQLVTRRSGKWIVDEDLTTLLEQLFGR